MPTATGQYLSRQSEDVQILNNIFSLFLTLCLFSVTSVAFFFFLAETTNPKQTGWPGEWADSSERVRDGDGDGEDLSSLAEPKKREPTSAQYTTLRTTQVSLL